LSRLKIILLLSRQRLSARRRAHCCINISSPYVYLFIHFLYQNSTNSRR